MVSNKFQVCQEAVPYMTHNQRWATQLKFMPNAQIIEISRRVMKTVFYNVFHKLKKLKGEKEYMKQWQERYKCDSN